MTSLHVIWAPPIKNSGYAYAHGEGFTMSPFIAERQAVNTNFYISWFEPTEISNQKLPLH